MKTKQLEYGLRTCLAQPSSNRISFSALVLSISHLSMHMPMHMMGHPAH